MPWGQMPWGRSGEEPMARVLVIDDEPDVLLLCRVNLQHVGHDVYEASDGEQGLSLAVTELPDAVVLDLRDVERGEGGVHRLGEDLLVDGTDRLAALRADDRTRDVPVLVLTAKAQREDRVRCWEQGASEYMTKPFSPATLATTLAHLMAMSPNQRDDRRTEVLRKLRDETPAWR